MASHSEILPDARRVLVIGAGVAGREAARSAAEAGAHVLLVDKGEAIAAGLPPAVARLPGAFAVDLVVEGGVLVGLLVLDGGLFRVLRASSAVLATGGVDGLFVPSERSGDGIAMAARAGLSLEGLDRLRRDEAGAVLGGGVAVKEGQTGIPNLLAAGEVASWSGPPPTRAGAAKRAEEEGRRAGRRAAALRGLPPAPGHLRMRPALDDPLPPGFIEVKVDRLRRVLREHWEEPERAIPYVLRLKGEADDFARARPQPELYSFQNACEVAMLLLKARR